MSSGQKSLSALRFQLSALTAESAIGDLKPRCHLQIARSTDRQISRFFSLSLQRCCDVVRRVSTSSWLSTEYSVNAWYISSQLCSDQYTGRCGAGFHLFFTELS